MLQDEVVPSWMTKDHFFLGLTQNMPRPLFNVSSYLDAVYQGIPGALGCFLRSLWSWSDLIFGMVPFWARLRHVTAFSSYWIDRSCLWSQQRTQ
jgi:chromate transporter